jgi:molecular chaperone IbpA
MLLLKEDVAMRSFDLTPLFRSSVGFDRMSRLLDAAARLDDGAPSYPPYNIEKSGESAYRITMAVAGFGESDLDVTTNENTLVVRGKIANNESENGKFLHRGIATRAFERRFELADFIKVSGARLENGLLHIDLVREVPEAMKPRSIKIEGGETRKAKVIEDKAA